MSHTAHSTPKISKDLEETILNLKQEIEEECGLQYKHPALVMPDEMAGEFPEFVEIGGYRFRVCYASWFPDDIVGAASRSEIYFIGLTSDEPHPQDTAPRA